MTNYVSCAFLFELCVYGGDSGALCPGHARMWWRQMHEIFVVAFLGSQLLQITKNKKNFKIVRKCVLETEGGWIWLTVTCSGGADCVGCIAREVINLLERLVPYLKE